MKKGLFILSLICLAGVLFTSPAKAQEDKDFHFTIKTNPLAALGGPFYIVVIPITGEYRVLFEAQTTKKQSVQIGVGYIGPSALLNLDKLSADTANVSGVKTGGFRGQITYKFFITGDDAPEGLYLAPYASYATAKIKNKDNTDDYFKATKLNVAGIIGYQMISSGGFALDIYTGLGFKDRNYEVGSSAGTSSFDFSDLTGKSGVSVTFGFNFGYAF